MILDELESHIASLRSLHGKNGDTLTVLTPEEIFALPKIANACMLGDNVIAKGASCVLAGQPSVGKTPLALQFIVAKNTSRQWCGMETHGPPMEWLYLQNENGRDRLERDLQALLKWAPDFDQSQLHIQVYQTDNDGFLSLDDPETVARIERTLQKYNPEGFVVDPLRDFGIGDLNTDADMIATLRLLTKIVRAGNPNRLLMTLHHALTGRAGVAKAFGLERAGFARNSKALLGWTRSQINVIPGTEDSNEILVLTCGRNSNGKEFPPVAIRRNDAGIYEVAQDYDIEAWREHVASAKGNRTPPVKDALRELLKPGRQYDKTHIARLIMEDKGVSRATAFRWVDLGKADKILHFNKTIKTYELT